ncbi:MAG: hypothetical protein ACK4KX_03190 [Parvibaculum sp.]|jgi:crotonobetainyl-CoA:carnitine CoA-transferase CaiB-like acyl-CoA transferase|uniref:hypothetical protein n=1 Tax=Parvibaculum sp. TaxID=2024848 RepID=UPI003918B2EC
MKWLKARAKEPTTYLGLSALIYGSGQLAKVNEAPAVADAVASAAPALAAGDWATGLMLLVGGILGALMREKGGR